MLSERIPLAFRGSSNQSHQIAVALRELTGRDELAVEGIDTACTVGLLEKLIDPGSRHGLASVLSMCATDRDKLLAALHRQYWGDRIVSTLTCHACKAPFDLSFKLSDLQTHLDAEHKNWRVAGECAAISGDGTQIRLPTAEQEMCSSDFTDEQAVLELANKLNILEKDIAQAGEQMEQAAPIIDLELAVQCPECEDRQQAHFDIQSFVMKIILNERNHLLSEIHLLASNYGWSLDEILDMPRTMRKTLTQILDDYR